MLSAFTPPVNFQPYRPAAGIDAPAYLGELRQRARDELLASKTGVHRHDQHQVELVQGVIEPVQRRGGLNTSPALQPCSWIRPMVRSTCSLASGWKLMMEAAGPGEVRDDAIDGLHHQMHVDGRLDAVLAPAPSHTSGPMVRFGT